MGASLTILRCHIDWYLIELLPELLYTKWYLFGQMVNLAKSINIRLVHLCSIRRSVWKCRETNQLNRAPLRESTSARNSDNFEFKEIAVEFGSPDFYLRDIIIIDWPNGDFVWLLKHALKLKQMYDVIVTTIYYWTMKMRWMKLRDTTKKWNYGQNKVRPGCCNWNECLA